VDIGKALGIPQKRMHQLTRLLGRQRGEAMAESVTGLLGTDAATARLLATPVANLADTPRHAAIHKGGMIVTAQPLAELTPPSSAPGRDVTPLHIPIPTSSPPSNVPTALSCFKSKGSGSR